MNTTRRLILATLAVVAVSLFPVLLLGLAFEDRVEVWFRAAQLSTPARFAAVVGLLATEIFVPIPSSAVSTWAGGVLGLWPATFASTLGMTVGAALGFALARAFGARLARRLSGEADLDRTADLYQHFGPAALAVTRALPILAEACVLFLGVTRLPWRRFWAPVVVGNFLVSLAYTACGQYFGGRGALAAAVVLSGTAPLLVALGARRWLPKWQARRSAGAR